MKKIRVNRLDTIVGGSSATLTGPIVNAFVNVIKVMLDAGSLAGSSIRRIATGNLCPLK